MKLRAKILKLDGVVGEPEYLEFTLSGAGSQFGGPGNYPIHGTVVLRAHRSVFKDYRIGDFFEINIEKTEGRNDR